ncbi:outer membrane biogenesis protein BamB [Novipirellula artificiosorum]|uniref:Outer membrane biogenesis protein BamB n=2 Tax=Novipirellula artificiosorum TaxID=2528016 RepID=A0A5C6DH10_9BACT|nr:outer membrane biogenesis protein BamB [Novipirellula artificiosorum]
MLKEKLSREMLVFKMCRVHAYRLLIFAAHCILPIILSGQEPATHDNPFLDADVVDTGWPHIRGPNYDGISSETRLADSWPDDGPPVLWVTELGQGYSSWVVKDNRAYTQYQSLAGQFVICLDASDGQPIWRYRYDWPFEATGLYPGPRSTPTIANNRIYFSTPLGAVGCLNEYGKLIWQQELKTKFDGKGTDFGYACSPTVFDGKVIMPVGGAGACMVALDAADGSILWASGDASASYTPALPITVDGHRQVIGYLENDLAAFDLGTGRELWRQHLSNGYDEHAAWPIFREPYLWTSAPFQAGSQLLRLSGGQNASFERVWDSLVMSNDVSSSVLVDEHLYGFDLAEAQSKAHRPSRGAFRSITWLSGKTSWSNGDAKLRRSTDYEENKRRQTIGQASLIAADGKLIVLNDLGDLILAKIDSDKYVELARTPAIKGDICWTSPALDRGRLFLRNHTRAVCIYIGEPALMATVARGEPLSVSDLPQSSVVDLASLLGVEPDYSMDPPTYRWLRIWFLSSLAILGSAGLFVCLIWRCKRSLSSHRIRWWFWATAMVLGLIVGSVASLASRDFVFTWPVTLFFAFQIAVYQSAMRRRKEPTTRLKKWQDRIVAILFLAVCFAYYYACRRLSLVTEWVFLCGFAASCPILLFSRVMTTRNRPVFLLAEFSLTLFAFAAFYGSAVVLLGLKYNLSDF